MVIRLVATLTDDEAENPNLRRTDWVMVAQDASVLAAEPFASRSTHDPAQPGLPCARRWPRNSRSGAMPGANRRRRKCLP